MLEKLIRGEGVGGVLWDRGGYKEELKCSIWDIRQTMK